MKNNLCLFERPFKIQKNGVFLFEISSFQRYQRFSIMQIRSVMTSYCLQLKSGKYWINDISVNIEAVFLKLGTTNMHQKRNKMTPLVLLPWQQLCRWCWVNKNRNSRFFLKTTTIYSTQSNDGTKDNMGTISVPSRTLCLTVEVANGDLFAFWQKETGAKRVAMETALRVSFCFK